nr:hypothetical protein [Micromonospora sp. DSM 115978]
MSATQVNLGSVETAGSFEVVSVGTSDVEYAVGPVPSWLSVTPDGGELEAGARAGLVVTLDRTEAPAGPVDVGIGISAVDGSGGGTVRVTAQVGGPPQIVSAVAVPSVIVPEGCAAGVEATQSVVR